MKPSLLIQYLLRIWVNQGQVHTFSTNVFGPSFLPREALCLDLDGFDQSVSVEEKYGRFYWLLLPFTLRQGSCIGIGLDEKGLG